MSVIRHYKLEKTSDGTVLYVYIKPYFVEFADENGNITENSSLKKEIGKIINKKFKKTKITACKVMLGTVLLGTIPAVGLPVYASSNKEAVQKTIDYTVKRGDTLWKISNRFNITVDEIKDINGLDHMTIYADQKLKIPTNSYFEYTVKYGDTLYKIANNNNTTVENIKDINSLSSDLIYPGQKLLISNTNSYTSVNVPQTYKVMRGDTLWGISKKYNISVNNIKKYNNLNSDIIYEGQVLNLKQTETTNNNEPYVYHETYKVEKGDNQWSISTKFGIPVTDLQKANGFNDSTSLSIGQEVKIPVHVVPVMSTKGEKYGEYMDWWSGAQYVFPINKEAKVIDYETGKTFMVKRTIGANHADTEPLTKEDTKIAKSIWGGYSWKTRPVIVEVDGRKIAASMSFMPHSIQYINDNDFDGHFDIHFLNSTRHVDGQIDTDHQENIKIAAGIV